MGSYRHDGHLHGHRAEHLHGEHQHGAHPRDYLLRDHRYGQHRRGSSQLFGPYASHSVASASLAPAYSRQVAPQPSKPDRQSSAFSLARSLNTVHSHPAQTSSKVHPQGSSSKTSESWPEEDEQIQKRKKWYFMALDSIFLCIYVVEAVLKIIALGLKYFLDPWNNLDAPVSVDFFIMVTAVLDFMLMQVNSFSMRMVYNQSIFRIFKVFKSLRALRAIRVLRRLRTEASSSQKASQIHEKLLDDSLTELIEAALPPPTPALRQRELLFHFLQLVSGVEHFQQKFRSQAAVIDEIVDTAFEVNQEEPGRRQMEGEGTGRPGLGGFAWKPP
eukprot:bmy_07785T0